MLESYCDCDCWLALTWSPRRDRLIIEAIAKDLRICCLGRRGGKGD